MDDSEGVTKTLSMLLQESGYTAIPAYTAEHALDVISGVAVDVVLLDINLPGRDGVSAAIEIRKRIPSCRIMLISGDTTSTEILERAKNEGIEFPVLAKPIPPAELLSTLRSLLKKRTVAAAASTVRRIAKLTPHV